MWASLPRITTKEDKNTRKLEHLISEECYVKISCV